MNKSKILIFSYNSEMRAYEICVLNANECLDICFAPSPSLISQININIFFLRKEALIIF